MNNPSFYLHREKLKNLRLSALKDPYDLEEMDDSDVDDISETEEPIKSS